jgi:hypothetical protein
MMSVESLVDIVVYESNPEAHPSPPKSKTAGFTGGFFKKWTFYGTSGSQGR